VAEPTAPPTRPGGRPSPATLGGRSSPAALGRGFRTLWTAAVLSRLGDAVRTPALALLAASLTREPRAVAAVVVAGQLPPLLFGLLGGVYADRWDRRRTMAAVDGLRAVTNLATSGLIAVIVLYALDVLEVPTAGYGLFMSAAVAGGLLGGLGAGGLGARLGTLPGLRWVLVAETLALAALAVSRHPVPGAIALAVFSAGTASWNALWSAYGQRNVPAAMLGRVGGAQRTVGLLAAPVGAVGAGVRRRGRRAAPRALRGDRPLRPGHPRVVAGAPASVPFSRA